MRTQYWPWLLAVTLSLAACTGGSEEGQEKLNAGEEAVQEDRAEKTRKIFYNIPSPMETASLLMKAGAQYNGKILNDVKSVDKYTSATKQALNLGVYGADLSYTSVFNNTQESMFYTSCSKKLADRLGVSSAFNDSTLEVMEKNQNDRDALLDIISETYWGVDAYLKENDRASISALMVTGGWVEGLYIATQVATTNDTPELRQRIAEQKLSLGDLTGLVSSYQDDGTLTGAKADLAQLQAVFADVQVGGDAPATLSDVQLKAIRDKAAAIRASYIN